MLKRVVADLHVHTVLSPCASYMMVPPLIVERALLAGLDLLGVTDHNSGENAAAVAQAAENSGVKVLPGMEVESREGVHILTLFDGVEALGKWQEIVYSALPNRENNERVFGAQLVVGAEGQLLGVNRRLLLTSVDLSLEEVTRLARDLGGFCVPAHVDRPAYGLLAVLGLLPLEIDTPALEISSRLTTEEAVRLHPSLAGRTLVRFSDAHTLNEIGRVSTAFTVAEFSVAEVALACRGKQGRLVVA